MSYKYFAQNVLHRKLYRMHFPQPPSWLLFSGCSGKVYTSFLQTLRTPQKLRKAVFWPEIV